MSGWGMSISGLDATLDLFDELSMQFEGNTTYVVGPTVKYAIWHEIGTSKMEARPFAQPAAERVQANLESKIEPFLEGPPTEEALVRATALAVEREMKRIVKAKDIWDTGSLHASIGVEPVG